MFQVHGRHLHLLRLGQGRVLAQTRPHRLDAQRLLPLQHLTQHLRHLRLPALRRLLQDLQVFPIRPSGLLQHQLVVGLAERRRRVQFFAITVAGERPGLAHQPIDHMAVVDPMMVLAAQSRHRLHYLLVITHLDRLDSHPRLQPFADQTRRYRIAVVFDADGAALAHLDAQTLPRLQPANFQVTQVRQFLGYLGLPRGIPLPLHLGHYLFVLLPAGELPATPQQQGLVQRLLEAPMALLAIAVLVTAGRVGRLPHHPVMGQQRPVAIREFRHTAIGMNGQRHAIGAVPLGRRAQSL